MESEKLVLKQKGVPVSERNYRCTAKVRARSASWRVRAGTHRKKQETRKWGLVSARSAKYHLRLLRASWKSLGGTGAGGISCIVRATSEVVWLPPKSTATTLNVFAEVWFNTGAPLEIWVHGFVDNTTQITVPRKMKEPQAPLEIPWLPYHVVLVEHNLASNRLVRLGLQ